MKNIDGIIADLEKVVADLQQIDNYMNSPIVVRTLLRYIIEKKSRCYTFYLSWNGDECCCRNDL